ncbi:GNAT family N-acetyltransferase (plasmid) [Legionella sp. D16C41]|uniref:GNAT family N-acetyltransferase n=1 Tax=Legionella sp. D16C41 TaxID=3402688 RepID=UPI003AF484FC
MKKEDNAILSTFIEVFHSFQLHPMPKISLQYDPKAKVALSGLNEIFFNNICINKPFNQEKLLLELKAIQAELKMPLTIWLTHETETPEFENLLKANCESPGPFYGMFLQINQAQLVPLPDYIHIETVTTISQAKKFAKIYTEVFHLNIVEECERWAIKQYEMDNPTCINFIARLEGKVAGVSSLAIDRAFVEFKTGGFYNACVLPEFRKKGVGTSMAYHRIQKAKDIGLESLSIVLMSDVMARGYCEKLGFKDYQTMTPFYILNKLPCYTF